MKHLFLTIILLTTALSAPAQGVARRAIFTIDYGTDVFATNPTNGRYTRASLPYAATYINAHRGDRALLINFGESNHSPEIIDSVRQHLGYDTSTITEVRYIPQRTTIDGVRRVVGASVVIAKTDDPAGVSRITNLRGDSLTFINFGPSPGSYLGVVDSLGNYRLVDITGFYADKKFNSDMAPLYTKLREYYTEPLATIADTLRSREHYFGTCKYSTLFHTFQIETSSAEISFFMPQRPSHVITGEITRGNLYLKDSIVVTLTLTGREITDVMQRIASGWFNSMNSAEDDMLKLHSYNDKLYPYYACFSAMGVEYSINLLRKKGSMVAANLNDERLYTVVCSERFARYLKRTDYTVVGNYNDLIWQWLKNCDTEILYPLKNWQIVPLNWVEAAKMREEIELF